MAFSDTIKKLIKNKEESDDTLPSDEVSISVQNEIENKLESINSGITEIHISILRIFDSIYSVNKMSKNLDVLEKPKTKKKNIVKNNNPEVVTRNSKSNALLFAAIAIAITMLLDWLGGFIENIVNSVRDAINSLLDLFYDTQLKFVDLFYNMEKGIVADLSYFVNTTIDLAYEASSAALSAFYGTITIFSSSEKKEKIQKEIEEFKAEGIKQRNYNISVTAKTTAEITSSQTLKKQNIEVSRISAKTTVDEGAQTIVTALKPTNIFSGVKSFFGGGGATGNISTEPYTGPQILSGSIYDAIIAAEGTARDGDPYNTSLGYEKSPKPLTSMTMKESLEWGDYIRKQTPTGIKYNSSAKGAFQIVNTTQKDAMKALGIGDNELFDEENQKRMAAWIWTTQGWRAWEGFKKHPEILASARDFIDKKVPIPPSSGRSKSSQPIVLAKNTISPQTTQKPKVPKSPPGIKTKIVVDTRDVHGIKDKHPPKDNHNHT